MIVFKLFSKLIPARSCLTCAGFLIGAIVVVFTLSLLFANISRKGSVNNCILYVICINRSGN